jgi:RNA polymerase sigma factor (sigma-70 family)
MMTNVDTAASAQRRRDEEVYARHAAELVRFATVLVGPSGADDLVADAVLKVFAHPGWPQVTNQRAYLYRAVLNQAHQQARSSARRRLREQRVAGTERIEQSLVRPEVLAAMRKLDPRQRAIVFFTYWQDLTTDQIAAELGLTTRNVQRQLAAARTTLQRELS